MYFPGSLCMLYTTLADMTDTDQPNGILLPYVDGRRPSSGKKPWRGLDNRCPRPPSSNFASAILLRLICAIHHTGNGALCPVQPQHNPNFWSLLWTRIPMMEAQLQWQLLNLKLCHEPRGDWFLMSLKWLMMCKYGEPFDQRNVFTLPLMAAFFRVRELSDGSWHRRNTSCSSVAGGQWTDRTTLQILLGVSLAASPRLFYS